MKKGLQWLVVGGGNGFPCWKRNLILAVTTLMYFRQASGSKNIFACVENDLKGVHREIWDPLPVPSMAAVKRDPRYPDNPTSTEFIWNLDAPRGRGHNFAQRLSAYFIAEETGNYTFYMACDDECELFISPDEHRKNAYLLISLTSRTKYRKWDQFGDQQKSREIQLTRDHIYYIAAVMTNSDGRDHLSVGQRLPSGRMDRPIANKYLIRYAPGFYSNAPPGDWEPWTPCSASCGRGVQVRNRTCIDPPPVYKRPSTAVNMTETAVCYSPFTCPEPPRRVMGYNTSSTSLFVTWLPLNGTWPQGRVVGYRVLYIPRNLISRQSPRQINTTEVSVHLKGLRRFTVYCIRVAAVINTTFQGPLSACAHATTDQDVPSRPPVMTSAHNTSSTTIRVNWDPVSIKYAHGNVLGYTILYHRHSAHAPSYYTTVPSDRHSVQLHGLRPFTEYCVRLSAYTKKGAGKTGPCKLVFTDESVPSSPPLNITAHNRTSPNGVAVWWGSVPHRHRLGIILGYKLRVRQIAAGNDIITHSDERVLTTEGSKREALIDGLETFASFMVEIAAFTRKGVGPFSEPIIAETCKCPGIFYTNWLSSPQFIEPAVNSTSVKFIGMFPSLLNNMVRIVCGTCDHNITTDVMYANNGKSNGTAQKRSLLEVTADMSSPTHLSFPIRVSVDKFRNSQDQSFIPVVTDVSGIAYLTKKKSADVYAKLVGSSVFKCWPLFVMVVVLNVLAGLVIWVLDVSTNNEHFPKLFLRGALEGVWCSFVTMTTVGYGDRVPKSVWARIFAVSWFLTGIVVMALFVSEVSTSLTVFTYNEAANPERGIKFGIIVGSMEYKPSLITCSKPGVACETYETMEDIFAALKSANISGVITDIITVSQYREQLAELNMQVRRVVDFPFEYGIVVVGDAAKLATEFKEYIRINSNTIKTQLQVPSDASEPVPTEDTTEQPSTKAKDERKKEEKTEEEGEQINFFDPSNSMYKTTLFTSAVLLAVAAVCGTIYQCGYVIKRFRHRRKGATQVVIRYKRQAQEEELKEEMRKLLNDFYKNFCFIYTTLKRKHKLQLQELARLKRSQRQQSHPKSFDCVLRTTKQTYDVGDRSTPENFSMERRPKDLHSNAVYSTC